MSDGLFISYRRADSSGDAGRIADYFAVAHPDVVVFMDVNAIQPGADFAETIEKGLASSSALLALIGARWLDATTPAGDRRLDDPNDFVRLELAVAIRRQLHVVPVLLDDASMPTASELPQALMPLTRHSAFRLRHDAFKRDVQALAEVLKPHLRGRPGTAFKQASDRVSDEVFVALVQAFQNYNRMDDPEVFMIIENDAGQLVQFIGNVDGEVLLDLPSHGLSPQQLVAAQRFLQQSYTIGTQDLTNGDLAVQTVVPAEARHLAMLTLSLFEQVHSAVPTQPLRITFGR